MADEHPPKKSKAKWFILLFLILLLGGVGYSVWHFGLVEKFLGGAGETAPKPAQSAKTEQKFAPAPSAGRVVSLKPFTTNLSDPLGRRFIKVSLGLEVANAQVEQELQQQEPRVNDSILMLLSSKTYADLATVESKLILKNEIAARLNQILGGPKITQVFITDLVIQ